MRIISGIFKGKKILEPLDIETRPLKDLTKESIFNIIKHSKKFKVNLEGATILDLFSGVGSFGIECLSRKAKKVIFVENYKNVLPILKKNLLNLKLRNNFEILEKNIYDDNVFYLLNCKFDIIFLDPPFLDNSFLNDLKLICEKKIFKKNHLVIIHREKKSNDDLENFVNPILTKNYGRSKIIFGKFLF